MCSDPRNDASAYSEYDDTREFCEGCGKVIEEGAPVFRIGADAWHETVDCVPTEGEAA